MRPPPWSVTLTVSVMSSNLRPHPGGALSVSPALTTLMVCDKKDKEIGIGRSTLARVCSPSCYFSRSSAGTAVTVTSRVGGMPNISSHHIRHPPIPIELVCAFCGDSSDDVDWALYDKNESRAFLQVSLLTKLVVRVSRLRSGSAHPKDPISLKFEIILHFRVSVPKGQSSLSPSRAGSCCFLAAWQCMLAQLHCMMVMIERLQVNDVYH